MSQTSTSCSAPVSVASGSEAAVMLDEVDNADPDPSEKPPPTGNSPGPGSSSPENIPDDASGKIPDGVPDQSPASSAACDVTLELHAEDCDPPVSGWLEDQLARIAELAGVESGRLAVAVVDDEQMARMHQQYCNQPGTTDVLTFDLREVASEPVEGDLVICMDEAHRQAQQRGHDTRLELLLYAIHGLMHLLGEDDHDEAGYQKMHKREDDLLTRAGLGPVFGL